MRHLRCGCEDGRDCTKTSVCAIETAVEDALWQQGDDVERMREVLLKIANSGVSIHYAFGWIANEALAALRSPAEQRQETK